MTKATRKIDIIKQLTEPVSKHFAPTSFGMKFNENSTSATSKDASRMYDGMTNGITQIPNPIVNRPWPPPPPPTPSPRNSTIRKMSAMRKMFHHFSKDHNPIPQMTTQMKKRHLVVEQQVVQGDRL
ncbi:MAG: hypothetical protein LC650_05755 [Actinobacteria bacterium]|nr:hypothetical protein [Actinomycetota bacterium]